MNSAAVILAAGKSTRMRSRLPKPLHPVCGLPLTGHVVNACRHAGIERVIAVIGFEADQVRKGLGEDIEYAIQAEQKGSGHAAQCAYPPLAGFDGTIFVLAGDVPLLRAETLKTMLDRHLATSAQATLLTASLNDPTGYGRIIRNPDGTVARIVEHRDATEAERAISEINPSIYCFDSAALFSALEEIRPNNEQGELYLTDVIAILNERGQRVEAVAVADATETLGVNTRVELAEVGRILRERILRDHMLAGVTITDPQSTYIDAGVQIGQDSTIEPQSYLHGSTVIGEGCSIGPFVRIIRSRIGSDTDIVSAQIVESEIGSECRIGPFANIRPNCVVADKVKIGDFVELKNARLGEKVSAGHFAYLGDADIGARVNIGAGTITCNYDGKNKHKTIIGEDAFIGSNSTLIAPVTIGPGAYVAAASPVNKDVPQDALVIARSRQEVKPGYAARMRERRKT